MKINLYRFVTSVCLFPTFDWAAFGQRIAGKIFSASLFLWLLSFLKTPLFFIGLVALLTYSPDTLAWIFIKIGEIEISIMSMLISALMPDLFSEGVLIMAIGLVFGIAVWALFLVMLWML